jgi:hypothetical protein
MRWECSTDGRDEKCVQKSDAVLFSSQGLRGCDAM